MGKGAGECLRVGRRSLGWPSPAPYLSSCLRQAKWERHQRESLRNSRWPQRLPLRSMTTRCEWWVPVCERNRLQSSRRALERQISLQAFLLWVHWPVRLPEIDKLRSLMAAACNPAGHRAKGSGVLTLFALRAGEGHQSVSLSHTLQGQHRPS